MYSVRPNSLSLKYQRFTSSGCKKIKFGAKLNSFVTPMTVYFKTKCWQNGIHVVFNAPENSKTERGGLNFVDPEKQYLWDVCLEAGSGWGLKCKTCGRSARPPSLS